MRKSRTGQILVLLLLMTLFGGLVGPDAVSAGSSRKVRLFAGPNARGDILWTIVEVPYQREPTWWIFEGTPTTAYRPSYTFTNEHFFLGTNVYYGAILFTFHRDTAYEGPNFFGPPLFHLFRNRIFVGGNTAGPIAYTIDGRRVFAGGNTAGEILLNASDQIAAFPGPLELVIAILLGTQAPVPPPPPPLPLPPPPPGPAMEHGE